MKPDIWPLVASCPLTGSAVEQRSYLVGELEQDALFQRQFICFLY
jgi:hypothetical protein